MDFNSRDPLEEEGLAPGTRIGDYEVTQRLGEGGMATVYAGFHPIIGKRVAIKVLRHRCAVGEAADRFVQEARALVAIDHPNIVDVFTFGRLPDGRCYFVMEYLDGRTLADTLDADGPLPVSDAFRILLKMCDALHAAHRAGIVHRDLKPQNVMLPPAAEVKLLDFGIAKLVGGAPTLRHHTHPGMTMGTPAYISPEQARGHDVEPSSDVYSLAIVAFEMVTGQLPFDGDTGADLMAAHLGAEPDRPSRLCPAVPRAFDALIGRMLAKEPTARPALAEVRAVLEELNAVPAARMRTLSSGVAGESLTLAGARRLRRRRALPALVAAGLIVLAVAFVERPMPLLPALASMAATPLPVVVAREPVPTVRLAPRVNAPSGPVFGPPVATAASPGSPGRHPLKPRETKSRVAQLPGDDFHTVDPWKPRR